MRNWINQYTTASIIRICNYISKDKFAELESEGAFEVSSAHDIRRTILAYLDGDHPKPASLHRINTPSEDYLTNNVQIFEINPKMPSAIEKKFDYDVMIDGRKSDLTIICRVYFSDGVYSTKIYDALTL